MKKGKSTLLKGIVSIALFAVWTAAIQTVDVQCAGETGTAVGFAAWNIRFHRYTGVNMGLYTVTDWLGLVPVFVCILFGGIGLVQLIGRRDLRKVERDILLLGAYYALVFGAYCFFEAVPIHYRPVLIEGRTEASYPSSTVLLVLSVMPTLVFQAGRRLKNSKVKRVLAVSAAVFSLFMVLGRCLSGVHWLADIVGSVLLSAGMFWIYKATVLLWEGREGRRF